MEYKEVSVSHGFTVSVPVNLSPDEEALYIASRIAFVDLEKLAAELCDTRKLWEEGKMIPLEDVLEGLTQGGASA